MRVFACAVVAVVLIAGFATSDQEKKAPAEPADTKTVKPIVVPFEMLKSGHMAVQVKVNDKGPYLLIFDTGAPISLVNSKMGRSAGLIKANAKTDGGLGLLAAGQATIKKLEVGGPDGWAAADEVPAVVMDHPTVAAISQALNKEIYGLVGFPFFARFKMTLDYKDKTMTLSPSGYKPPDVMKAMNSMMMSAILGKQAPRVLSASAQWGLMASKKANDKEDGVDIKTVVPGGAADKAGLKSGDRLLTLDGRWTDTLEDLYEAAGFVKPGATVVVVVNREGKEVALKVTPSKGM